MRAETEKLSCVDAGAISLLHRDTENIVHRDTENIVRHRAVNVGEVTLHVAEAGPSRNAPLVVLLHGFPAYWWTWRSQMRALSNAGFHVVAPDLRGFHLSDKPSGVRRYRLAAVAADIAELTGALRASKAAVIGHDWGGAVAWELAQHRPVLVERLGIINVPHPLWWRKALLSLKQLRKSWYMLFFQLPWLPERWLRRDDFRNLRRFFFEGEGVDAADVQRYVDAAKLGDDLRAALGYYRAWVRLTLTGGLSPLKRIETPTLVIWGTRDRFIGPELAVPDPDLVPNARVELVDASHWVQHDAPESVNGLLLQMLSGAKASAWREP